jgi:PHD/YefM family antitoxin component YafN of YafNO toxin-antitoxin module
MPRKTNSQASLPVVRRLPITQARNNLGALVKQVHLNKEYVILEKDGIPIAGIMDIDEFEDYLELQDPKVRAHIRNSHEEYLAGKSRPAEALLAELQREATGRRGKTIRPQGQ